MVPQRHKMKVASLEKYPMNHSFMPSRLQVVTEKEERRNCLLVGPFFSFTKAWL